METQNELEAIYHPPLDPALIAAISNDTDDIDEAKATLDILQAEAIADGFEEGYESPSLELSDAETDLGGSLPEDMAALTTREEQEIGENDNLRFLKLSFPKQNVTTLKFVLGKSHNDVLKAVDELLNHDLIDEERRLNAIVDGEAGTIDDFFTPTSTSAATAAAAARRKKRKHRIKDAAALPAELANQGDGHKGTATPVKSRWEQMSSEVDWVSRALSLPAPVVQSAYHAHNSSLPAALNALVEETTWVHERTDGYAALFERLHKSHPGLGIIKAQHVLDATRENYSLALDVANVLAAWRPALGNINANVPRQQHRAGHHREEETTAAVATARDDGGSALISAHGKSAAECRAMAAECATRRDAAFRQAATAHQKSKSDGLHGGSAMYYAEIGRECDAKMRAWNLQAAKLASTARSGQANDLDLHGLSVHEGLAVTKEGLTKWYASTRMLDSGTFVTPLRIVTGRGNHSVGGEARLLPAVKKYLDRESWRYSVVGGCITVTSLAKK